MSEPINGLPPHLSQEEIPEAKEEVVIRHQWLYSVVPVGRGNALAAYLTGFCRGCGRAFSQRIPTADKVYLESVMDVPQFGCIDPMSTIG